MPRFRVKQRWLSGQGKKQWASGDEVTEADFPNNFDELLSEGRIEVIPDSDEAETTDETEPANTVAFVTDETTTTDETKTVPETTKTKTTDETKAANTDASSVTDEPETTDETEPANLSNILSAMGNPVFVKEDGTKVFVADDCLKSDIVSELTKLKHTDFKSNESKASLWNKLISFTPE